jgi:hypothetical protein
MKLPFQLRSPSTSAQTKRKALKDALDTVIEASVTPKDLRTKLRKTGKEPVKSAQEQTTIPLPVPNSTADTASHEIDTNSSLPNCTNEITNATLSNDPVLRGSLNGPFISPLLPGIVFEADKEDQDDAAEQNAGNEEHWRTTGQRGHHLSPTLAPRATDVDHIVMEQYPSDFAQLLHEKNERIRVV